jgi:hypothetical protein
MSADPMLLYPLTHNSIRSGREVVERVQEVVADLKQHISILEHEYMLENCCLASCDVE